MARAAELRRARLRGTFRQRLAGVAGVVEVRGDGLMISGIRLDRSRHSSSAGPWRPGCWPTSPRTGWSRLLPPP